MTRKEAQIRNHKILRLRGMWSSAQNLMEPDLAKQVQDLIDQQLIFLGALPTKQQREKFWKDNYPDLEPILGIQNAR